MSLPTFTLTSAATNAAAPFVLGHAFKKGDVPAGSQVVAPFADFQVTPKNAWPDGSLKFAILAGKANITGGSPMVVALSIGTPSGGTSLTTADLKATGITAAIDCGAFGAVSWATTDWDSPFEAWAVGPKMASWVYRKPVGSDPHLVAWLEVRLWAGGAVSVLPWIENGYFRVAGPTRKNALYTFTLGGASRFSDYVGINTTVTYTGGATFTTGYGGSAVSPLRVRSGSLLGTATWQSTAGVTQTYAVTWDTTNPGTISTLSILGLPHHTRTPLLSGAALAHWLATDPSVTPLHDPAYLQSSELVPTYGATLTAGAARVAAQATTFTPFQQGGFEYNQNGNVDSMANSGYGSPIGLLPEHDVLHLVANAADRITTYNSVVRNGFSAGRYAIHFRDEATQRPPAFSTYPTLVFYNGADNGIKDMGGSTTSTYTPNPTGGDPPKWDTSHCPSIGYMAYLLTGRFYFKEETQFAAIANHFHVTDWVRGGGNGTPAYTPRSGFTGASGICNSVIQTRHGAWAFRSLAQALAATPDSGDPLRTELIASVEDNCRYFHDIYVAQSNNPFGIIEPAADEVYTDVATDRRMIPIWQQDFGTAAWGMALAFDLPISAPDKTKMAAFFAWKAKSVVHRCGTAAGFRFERAGVYEYAASPATAPNFQAGTGPWYTDDAAAYAGTMVNSYAVSVTTGALYYNTSIDGPPEKSIWGNLMPALAYAVRHGVTGAAAGYARLTGASNYSTMSTGFNATPVWSVQPASTGATITMPTPGPKIRIGQLFTDRIALAGFPGFGITPAQVATGHANMSLLERHIVGADPTSEFLWAADTVPAGLTMTIYPDSSFAASAADGTYNGNKTVYTDGAGSAGTYQMVFGVSAITLTAAGSTQANGSSQGAITQDRQLSATGSIQSNASAPVAITQGQQFTVSGSLQSNQSAAGAITQGVQMTVLGSVQQNTSSAASIVQVQQLFSIGSTQTNTSSQGAVGQSQTLAGSGVTQSNFSSGGAITQAPAIITLVAAPSTQINLSPGRAVVAIQVLSGSDVVQVNVSRGGALTVGDIHAPPPEQTFRFKPGIDSGFIPGSW